MVATTTKVKEKPVVASAELDIHELDVCPRCGEHGFLTRHWAKDPRYVYAYFIHKGRIPGSCYLGKRPEKWFWTKADKDRVSEELKEKK